MEIGPDEYFGTRDRVVDMGFGGEVDHAVDSVFMKDEVDEFTIDDVTPSQTGNGDGPRPPSGRPGFPRTSICRC
ncbi:MAG: hypothetical protein MZV63_30680 [Marinilabiliales bacterium]|nr:hypothetical protein [Marinilabiliales bacterium]